MSPTRLLFPAVLACLLTACSLPIGKDSQPEAPASAAQILLKEFFQPDAAERRLSDTLTVALGLENVRVDYQEETIRVAFEMPDGLSTGQSMLLFTSLLDMAARNAPFSQTVELAVLVGGEPFYTLVTGTQAVADHRVGKLTASELILGSRLLGPDASSTAAAPDAAPSAPAPEPASIDGAQLIANIPVLASVLHADPYGNWSILGAVANDNDVVVSGVQLAYRVTDANGTILHEGREQVAQYRIAPGMGCAFSLYIPWSDAAPAGFELAVEQAAYDPYDQELPILEMVDTRILPGEDGQSAVLVGLLHNPYSRAVSPGALTALGVDSSGLPLSAAVYGTTVSSLDARSSAPFRLVLEGMSPEELASLNNTILFSEGWFTDPAATGTLQLSPATRYFRASDGSSHILGVARNTGRSAWSGRLLGVLYDAQGSILDIAQAYVPGDPIPAEFEVAFDVTDFRVRSSLIAEQAARFEVTAYGDRLSEGYTVEATALSAGVDRVTPGELAVQLEATVAPFASGFDEVVYVVNLWSADGQTLLGTRSGTFDVTRTEGGTIGEFLAVDPAPSDPGSAVAEVQVFGIRRPG